MGQYLHMSTITKWNASLKHMIHSKMLKLDNHRHLKSSSHELYDIVLLMQAHGNTTWFYADHGISFMLCVCWPTWIQDLHFIWPPLYILHVLYLLRCITNYSLDCMLQLFINVSTHHHDLNFEWYLELFSFKNLTHTFILHGLIHNLEYDNVWVPHKKSILHFLLLDCITYHIYLFKTMTFMI
jgi:hypothetical protein